MLLDEWDNEHLAGVPLLMKMPQVRSPAEN
jgi:hypothetical protein